MIVCYLILLILIKLVLFVVVLGLISIMVHLIIIICIVWVIVIILFSFIPSLYELVVLVNEVFCHIIIGNQSLPLDNFLLVKFIVRIFDFLCKVVIGLFLVDGLNEILFTLYEPFTIFRIWVSLILLEWGQIKLLKFVIVGVPAWVILDFGFYVAHNFLVWRHDHKWNWSFGHRFKRSAYPLVF